MINDYFNIAWKNLKKRQLRSWLTILGIIISVAIIFVLISLSVGLRGAINEQFQILGSDKFFIMPKGQLGAPGTGGAVELTLEDFEVVKKVPGVDDATYFVIGNGKIDFNKQTRYMMVIGMDLESADLFTEGFNLEVQEGRFMKEGERGKVILGWDYGFNNVFEKPVKVGSTIEINDKEFEVEGIMERVGNPSDDKNIMISVEDAREMFNSGDRVDEIIAQTTGNLSDVADSVDRRLIKFRNVDERTRDYTISTPEELLASFSVILNIITAFLVGVAAISLLVGSIGIANTMFTSVLERTKEIGTMKAIGGKNSDILLIFLFESGLIGLAGGIIGVLLGVGISKTIEFIAINQLGTTLLKAATPIWLILGSLAFAFLIGAVSGVIPARNAAKLSAVDALRYE